MTGLTFRERAALDFITARLSETGIAPTYLEIAHAAAYARKGSAVSRLVNALEAKGAIRRLPGRHHAIEVVGVRRADPLTETPVAYFLAPLLRIDQIHRERAR